MSDSPFSSKTLLISSSPSCDKHVQTPVSDGKTSIGAVRSLKNEVANLQCETSYLLSELDLTKNELNKCKNEAEAKARRILRLENELFAAQSGKPDEGSLRRRRRSAVGRERELREEVRMLEAINSSLNNDLDAAHSNAHILTEKVSELEKEKIKFMERNDELEESISLLKSQVESNEKLINELQITCQDLRDVLEESSDNSVTEKRSLNRSLITCDNTTEEPLTSVVEIKYAELETQFHALESDLSEAKSLIKNKDLEFFNLKKDLEIKMAEIALLNDDLEKEKSLNKAFDGSKIQLEELVKLLKEEIKALNFGISTKKVELGLLECRNFDLQDEVNSLNNLMFDSEMELFSLKKELLSTNSNVSKYEGSIKNLEEMVDYYKLEKNSLMSSVDSLNERMSDLTADNQYITALNEALVLDNKNQKVLISRLQNDKIDDSKKLTLLTSLYDETNVSLQQKLMLISQLEEKVLGASQDKEALMEKMNQAMQALESTLLEQKAMKNVLETKVTTFEKEVVELKLRNSELNEQITSMHKDNERSCEIMKDMKNKLTEFEAKIKLKCEREKDLQGEISVLQSNAQKKENELNIKNDCLQQELKEKENTIQTLNKELNSIKELYNSGKEEQQLLKADSNSKLEVKSQELDSLKMELSEALKSHSELLENHNKLCELKENLCKNLEESKKSIEIIQKELKSAKSNVEEKSKLLCDSEKKSNELASYNSGLKKELTDKESLIETLNKELNTLKKSYNEWKEEQNLMKADLNSKLAVKSQELDSLKIELAEAHKSLESQSVLIENHKKACELQDSLRKELDESKKSIDSLQVELSRAKNIVDEHSKLQCKLSELQKTHESALKELHDRETKIQEKLNAEQEISKNLQQKSSEFESEFHKAQSKCDELVAKIAQDALTIIQKDEMIDCLNNCLKELIEALKITLDTCDTVEIIASIKTELQNILQERDAAVNELKSSQHELQTVKAQMAMLKEENVSLTDVLEQAQSSLDLEVDINCDLKKELDIVTTTACTMKTEIENVKYEMSKKDTDLLLLNTQLESEIKGKQELTLILSKTEQQLKEMDENYNNVIEKIKSDHSFEIENKNSEIEKLNGEMEIVSGSLQDLRIESEVLLGSLDRLKENNIQLNSHLENMSEHFERCDNFSDDASVILNYSSDKLENGQCNTPSLQKPQDEANKGELKKNDCDKYEFQVQDLSEKLNVANGEIKRLNQEYEISLNRIEFLSKEIVQLAESNENITNINNFLKTSVCDYETKITEYISKIKVLEDKLLKLDNDVSKKILVDDHVFHDLQVLQNEIDILKENSTINKGKAQLADSLNFAIQKCQDLIKMLQIKDEIISTLSVQPSSLMTLNSNVNLDTVSDEVKREFGDFSDAKLECEKSSLELINEKLTEEVMAQSKKLSIIRQKLEQSNNMVSRKAADITILECEKRDYLMEIRQLQNFISDLSVILCKEHNTSLETVLDKNDTGDVVKEEVNLKNTRLLCYDNYRCLKKLLQTIHQVFGDESIIVRGDNMFIDNLSETDDSCIDFEQKELDELSLLEKEQRIIYVIKDQLEMVIVVLKEKNERLSQVCKMRSDAEANLRVSKERAVLLEDELFKMQLEVDQRESFVQEVEKLRLHETGLLRAALETREASIEHLRERISYLEDSESRLTVELKVKIEELTKLSYDLGNKLKQAYFERDSIANEASTKEASLNKNLTLLENLIKEKEEENAKLSQSIKMLEHEKSVLDRRVCFLTKDLEELKRLNNPVMEEVSNELQLTDEQKLTLKPSIQKELVDDPRLSTGARSLQLSDRPKKEVGQITYHKPGPPTPSKNGRLSLSEVPPHMSTEKPEAVVDCDKENHGKIRNLFTAKAKNTQVPAKKKGFFRRKFGKENASSNV